MQAQAASLDNGGASLALARKVSLQSARGEMTAARDRYDR